MAVFMDIKGTSQQSFQLQKGGARLKNASGVVQARNAGDTNFADFVAQVLRANSSSLVLNTNAAGSGADWVMTIARPSSGMTAAVTYTLPAAPVNGNVLSTDSSGNLSWVAPASTAGKSDLGRNTQTFSETTKTLLAGVGGQRIFVHSLIGRITQVFDVDPLLTVGDTTTPSSIVAAADFDLSQLIVGDLIHIPYGAALTTGEGLRAAFGGAPTTGNIQWSFVSILI